MASFTEMLGAKLMSKNGEVATAEALAGKKAVGLYFSAHWCPPCRGFTPKLAEFYTSSLKAKGLEIVFVSSDRDENSFKSYFVEQPWLALPYSDRELKEKLSKKFKVQGIPTFVVLDGETGTTITTDGRASVLQDPTGEEFPWKPKPFAELFGESFLKSAASDEKVGREATEGKVVGIYFSAHWCPPCRGFTPKLVDWYKKVQAQGHPFEIIFASSDRDEAAFKEYFGDMPWLALPHGDKRKEKWSQAFGVSGIPTFVILDKELNTITKDGREVVSEFPEGDGFPWLPKPPAPIRDLAKPKGIQETPSVVLFMETTPTEEQEKLLEELEPLATKYRDAAWEKEDKEPEVLFFAAKSSEGPAPRVRSMTKQEALPPAKHATSLPPKGILLDLDDNGAFYELEGEVTAAAVEKFLADFKAGSLTRKQCEN